MLIHVVSALTLDLHIVSYLIIFHVCNTVVPVQVLVLILPTVVPRMMITSAGRVRLRVGGFLTTRFGRATGGAGTKSGSSGLRNVS
jgi:hypothetical protein